MALFDDDDVTEFMVTCPHCGEQVEIYLEPDVMGTLKRMSLLWRVRD